MIGSLASIAEKLGGDVRGDAVLAPGPGHSAADRSLSIKVDPAAPDGFIVFSFADDDAIACRDYVRERLDMPAFEATKKKNGGAGALWKTIAEYVYRGGDGVPYLKVKRCTDGGGKKQFPQYHFADGNWLSGKPAGGKIPYHLPGLIAAPLNAPVYFAEGEKDADTLVKLGFVATTASEGAGAPWDPALTPWFKDRPVIIVVDSDATGRKHGQKVAKALHGTAASIKVIDLFPDRTDGSDISDFIKTDPAGSRLAQRVKEADEWAPGDEAKKTDEEVIAELAALPKLAYAKARKDAAKALGITAGELDVIVAEKRGEGLTEEIVESLYQHWSVEPSDDAVDGDDLLKAVVTVIRKYVFIGEDQALAVALWIVFSWLHDDEAFCTHSPILLITSAEKDSGKSTLLGVINFLARRSLQSVGISGPALFRSLAKWSPTLIVDEADNALSDNIDLRTVINSGWTRGQGVVRCHADTRDPELFSTFSAKVIAMKGRDLPDTTLSRAIVIEMKPRRPNDPGEATADFDHNDREDFTVLRSQLMRWTADKAGDLAKAKPTIPASFHNRRRANWVPLLAIAEAAGWKEAGAKAATAIEEVAASFDPSIGVQLLRSIKGTFEARGLDRISSADLIANLIVDETGPWAGYNRGKPFTQRQVANLLKPFTVRPGTIRLGDGTTIKGYRFAWLEEAFTRFCPSDLPFSPTPPSTIRHADTDLFSHANSASRSVTEENDVTDRNDKKAFQNKGCDGVTDRKGGSPGKEEKEAPDAPGTDAETCENRIDLDDNSGADIPGNDDVDDTIDRSCRQCGDTLDGSERPYEIDGETIWLHPECRAHRMRSAS